MKKRVVVAMSGGVDSSVSAALLKSNGYDVIGVSLQLYDPVSSEPGKCAKTCCSLDDVLDAGRVANKLGIPFEVFDMRAEFRERVVNYFIAEYASGRTPNPCIRCNELIKFDLLLHRARSMGADLLATGHYARIERDADRYVLKTGIDPLKDQSYFLFTLTQQQMSSIIFPVGGLEKRYVREVAAEHDLPVAGKRESQEVCFIPDNNYVKFLEANGFSPTSGEIITGDGNVIGHHNGLHRYTVGQRKGLGVSWSHPLHVIALDIDRNQVVVGHRDEMHRSFLTAGNATWGVMPARTEFRVSCRIRYRHQPAPCRVRMLPENRFELHFDTPQMAITRGQAAVLYDWEDVLGGGWIE